MNANKSGKALKELPGWEESLREVNATLTWPLGGDIVRIVGAFVPPPSVVRATAHLVYNMAVAIQEHRGQLAQVKRDQEKREAKVVDLYRYSIERQVARQLGQDPAQCARAAMPFRPVQETLRPAKSFGQDGEFRTRERPPWAPNQHEVCAPNPREGA